MNSYRLSDLIRIHNGTKYNHLNDGVIPVYGSGGIMCYVDEYLYEGEAVLLPRKGTLNNIMYTNGKIWTVDTMYYSTTNDLVLPYYLYCYLSLLDLQHLDSGSTLPSMTKSSYNNIEVKLPALDNQKNIANVMSAIDKKIKLNNKINNELEAMAKLIYDYWFVQFDFPDADGQPYKSSGGKMVYNEELKRKVPDGWESKYLSELSDRIGDGIHGTPKYTDSSEFSFINGNNLKNGFINVNEETKKITSEEYEKYFIKLDKNTILLSINGTLGNLAVYTDEKVMLGKSSAYINCIEGHRAFCYQYLNQKHIQKNFWNIASGSTIKNLSLGSLKNLKLVYPGLELVAKFNDAVHHIDDKRENIFKENQKLIELRDWLLPMLMNGQVTIKNKKAK